MAEEVPPPYYNNLYSEFQELCINYLYQGTPIHSIKNIQPVVNLLPSIEKTTTNNIRKQWERNAQRLSSSISEMSNLLEKESQDYCNATTPTHSIANKNDVEDVAERRNRVHAHNSANDLERTVVSFIARTANQIEKLRRSMKNGVVLAGGDVECHRSGVVSILVQRLREEIVNEMSEIRKLRMKDLAKVKEEEEQKRQEEEEVQEVFPTYEEEGEDDYFMVEHSQSKTDKTQLYHRMHSSGGRLTSIQKVDQSPTFQTMEEENETTNSYQQQQQQQQLVTIHDQSNALTEVNQMEQTMIQITTLLNQFAILISDQQEDIILINEKTKQSKENVEKGTDSLLDASERTRRSGHYMAKLIFSLSILLLVMNWIFP